MRADLPRYRAGAWTLASDVPLDLPPASSCARPDWTFSAARERRRAAAPPFHRWLTPDGRRWLTFSRGGDDYLLRVSRLAWFRVAPSRRLIVWERPHTVGVDTLGHLLLNQIVPLALSTHAAVLHASVVALPAGALVMAGSAGAGKSTLAAALVRQGHRLVSDDSAVLEVDESGWSILAGVPRLRLWPEALEALYGRGSRSARVAPYTRKRRVDACRGPVERCTALAAICVLDPRPLAAGAPPSVHRLTPRDALVALLPHTLRLDVADRGRFVATLDWLAGLARAAPVFAVRLDRRLPVLASQTASLVEVLSTAAPGPWARPPTDRALH